MARLEDLTPDAVVSGVNPTGDVSVVAVKWYGSNAVNITYRADISVTDQILHRDHEPRLTAKRASAAAGRRWGSGRAARTQECLFGAVALDPELPQRSFTKIYQELVQHLSAVEGAKVEIAVGIKIDRPDGFPKDKVRHRRKRPREVRPVRFRKPVT